MLENIKSLYAEAYKSTMNAVETRAKEVKNSQNDGEVNAEKAYNGSASHLLKWHTGLTKDQVVLVGKWIRNAGTPEANKIVNASYWYSGRLDGKSLFVIYSTENVDDPTILYLSKGKNADADKISFIDFLEELENEKRTRSVRTQKASNTVLGRDWVQETHDLENSDDGFGNGIGDSENASILQRKSPQLDGSKTFKSVVYDLLKREADGGTNYSLKDSDYLELSQNSE